jgi:hypothetical protein
MDVNGVRVFYRESLPDRSDAPALLLLHAPRTSDDQLVPGTTS